MYLKKVERFAEGRYTQSRIGPRNILLKRDLLVQSWIAYPLDMAILTPPLTYAIALDGIAGIILIIDRVRYNSIDVLLRKS